MTKLFKTTEEVDKAIYGYAFIKYSSLKERLKTEDENLLKNLDKIIERAKNKMAIFLLFSSILFGGSSCTVLNISGPLLGNTSSSEKMDQEIACWIGFCSKEKEPE